LHHCAASRLQTSETMRTLASWFQCGFGPEIRMTGKRQR
jgi:hypothetical protein